MLGAAGPDTHFATIRLLHLGGGTGMWDEEDGFFYDVLKLPDGQAQRLKVRSMVGLLPFCAATRAKLSFCA